MNKKELKKELETQDNRGCENPMYVVYSLKEYPTTEDYSYNRCYYIEKYSDVDVGETGEEVIQYLKDQDMQNLEELENLDDYDFDLKLYTLFDIEKVFVFEVPQFEQIFFTEKAAKEYLRVNGHNLTKPYIYGWHMHRNKEMQEIRDYFMEKDK